MEAPYHSDAQWWCSATPLQHHSWLAPDAGHRPPKVHHNLLGLLHIQVETVVLAPPGQEAHLTPADCLSIVAVVIVVVGETHHRCVICEPDEEELDVGVQSWVSRVKRRGSAHLLGGPLPTAD